MKPADYLKAFVGILIVSAIVIAILGMLFASCRLAISWFAEHPPQVILIGALLIAIVFLLARILRRNI